jgi:dCMP deaminase
VITSKRRVLATGFNGSLPGFPHCDDVGHDIVTSVIGDKTIENCARTVHAEANAIAQAARHGTPLEGATIYVNTFPCWPCFRLLVSAGIAEVVYEAEYGGSADNERVSTAASLMELRHRLVFRKHAP